MEEGIFPSWLWLHLQTQGLLAVCDVRREALWGQIIPEKSDARKREGLDLLASSLSCLSSVAPGAAAFLGRASKDLVGLFERAVAAIPPG